MVLEKRVEERVRKKIDFWRKCVKIGSILGNMVHELEEKKWLFGSRRTQTNYLFLAEVAQSCFRRMKNSKKLFEQWRNFWMFDFLVLQNIVEEGLEEKNKVFGKFLKVPSIFSLFPNMVD